MSKNLTTSSTKLLALLSDNHGVIHHCTENSDNQFVNLSISVAELNKISEAMSHLATLVQLNPSFKPSSVIQ